MASTTGSPSRCIANRRNPACPSFIATATAATSEPETAPSRSRLGLMQPQLQSEPRPCGSGCRCSIHFRGRPCLRHPYAAHFTRARAAFTHVSYTYFSFSRCQTSSGSAFNESCATTGTPVPSARPAFAQFRSELPVEENAVLFRPFQNVRLRHSRDPFRRPVREIQPLLQPERHRPRHEVGPMPAPRRESKFKHVAPVERRGPLLQVREKVRPHLRRSEEH